MGSRPDTWRRHASKQIADCRVFTVREDESVRVRDRQNGKFFVIECPNWVNVIAMTADERVVLIEQFRHGVEKTVLEIPGGMVDAGEEPPESAKRELAEETGYTSDNWTLLGRSFPNPAIQNNQIFHFLALDCTRTSAPRFDEHESITTRLVSVNEVRDLIIRGEIGHSLVIAAFYYLFAQGGSTKRSVTITRAILVFVVLAFVGQMAFLYTGLPATVASHFDGEGNPNGWMSKEVFLLFEIGLLVFVVGEFLLVPRFIRRLPRSLINMPNKDYWLSDEHREETMSIFRNYFELFGAVIVILFVIVNQFVYYANISHTNLFGSTWIVIVGFLAFTIVWVIRLISEFRLKK